MDGYSKVTAIYQDLQKNTDTIRRYDAVWEEKNHDFIIAILSRGN